MCMWCCVLAKDGKKVYVVRLHKHDFIANVVVKSHLFCFLLQNVDSVICVIGKTHVSQLLLMR
jgi:hypothetical protein